MEEEGALMKMEGVYMEECDDLEGRGEGRELLWES